MTSVDSGLLTLKLTSSAHVFTSGKSLVSTSLKVRVSLRLSAFDIISTTSETYLGGPDTITSSSFDVVLRG